MSKEILTVLNREGQNSVSDVDLCVGKKLLKQQYMLS